MGRYPIACLAMLLMLPFSVCRAEKLPKADRMPAVPTAEQRALIREGIEFHDRGEYEVAVARYQQVLDETPDAVEAMYECAFSLSAMKEYEKSLALSRRGAQYRSDLLWQFHMLMGSALDDLGKSAEAITLFKDAIKQSPKAALLHYNLGLTLARTGKVADAKKALQQSLYFNPQHGSSHLLLARMYEQLGYRVPAILALSRFLTIEPNSPRGQQTVEALGKLLDAGVSAGAKPNEIIISLGGAFDSKKDEGDFSGAEIGLSMSAAAAMGEAKTDSRFQQWASTYVLLAESVADVKGNGFAARYYAPFFAQLADQGFIEAFAWQVRQSVPLEGSETWRSENPNKVSDYQAWLSAYRWPAPK
jgi:tetratricopeptide (TPR) repeat protein